MSRCLILLVAFAGLTSAALPKGWKACSKSSKDYDKCFVKEANNAIMTLINGDKKMGVHPLDPLRISTLEIPNNPGPVNLNLSFKDLDVTGIKDLKIVMAKNDWKTLVAKVKIPDLICIGQYRVAGKVLVLPITGNGKCNLTFHDLDININIRYKQIQKSGKLYFQMEKFLLEMLPKRLYMSLENLFNGDKALGDNMNVFLNENWDQILAEISPGLTKALSQAFTLISNTILAKIPTDEIDKK